MKFSLLLICFSSLEAKQSFNTVPEDKPLMYFDGKEWRERKPNRYSAITGNQSTIERIDFDTFEAINITTVLNNTVLGDNDIHKRASDKESADLKQDSTSENNVIESETNMILNQLLNFIETRHSNTKDTYASASLSTNPEAWIKLLLELSKALKEIALRANESYYMLIQEPTPSFAIETWRSSYQNRRENEGLDGLMGIFTVEETGNDLSQAEHVETHDRKNEIYMNKNFPLKLNLRQNLKDRLNQRAEVESNRFYIDPGSEDVESDGIEEIRILKRRK